MKCFLFAMLFVSVIAQAAAPPDCIYSYRFSNRSFDTPNGVDVFGAVGATPAVANFAGANGGTTPCSSWIVAYNAEGYSGVSLAFQSAARAVSGTTMVAGSFATFGGASVSGSNPMTSTTGGTYVATGYYPYVRINVATLTGTGSVDIVVMGWRSPTMVTASLGAKGVIAGFGDGTNAIAAATYPMWFYENISGAAQPISRIKCRTDNNGTSTLDIKNGAGTSLLTAPITCTAAGAVGTQSATVTLAADDTLTAVLVADGTTKQFLWAVSQ